MNLNYFRPKMRGNVENQSNKPVNITFVDKTFLTCLSLCSTQARAVNLIHAVLCDVEGVTQARGCWRHETGRRVER